MNQYKLSTNYTKLKEELYKAPPYSYILGFTCRVPEEVCRIWKDAGCTYNIDLFAGTDAYKMGDEEFIRTLEDFHIGFVEPEKWKDEN